MSKTAIGYTHPPEHIARRDGVVQTFETVARWIGEAYVSRKTYEERLLYVERNVTEALRDNPRLN